MIDQSVLQSAERNYVPYVLSVSMGWPSLQWLWTPSFACSTSPDARPTALSRARSVTAKGAPMMTSMADIYRKNADDCIQLAEHSLKPSDKECLLKFAQQWLQLAQEAHQAER